MTALPSATTATDASATEGDVKNFLIGLRDYLNGLFGATGVTADARTALGVTPLTYSNVLTALGYTPANLANAAGDHNHSGVYHDYNEGRTAFASASSYVSGETRYIRLNRINGGYVDVQSTGG